MPNKRRITRSLALSTVALGLLLSANSALAFQESPALAAGVAAGTLPAVDLRLPEMPEVITPLIEVGTYGGKLRRALGGSSDHNSILRIVSPQGLTRWKPDFSAVIPNVAESWTTNEEGSEFTFKLRKGMKWSDGVDFTADDIMFFVDDLLNNPEFYPSPPSRFAVDGKTMTAEKIDDYTVTLKFASSYGTFLTELATPLAQEPVLWAKHYCSQFMPKYNPDVQKLVDETNAVEDWPSLFRLKCGEVEAPNRWANSERPTLDPWVVTGTGYSAGATQVTMERNAYFWQVDTAGNQLPYIDSLEMTVAQDTQAIVLEAVAGHIDMQSRRIANLSNKPVLSENAEKGGYKVIDYTPSGSNSMVFHPNLTHKDPAKREFLNNKDVRIALSLAIDRDELIDIVWSGLGSPYQIGPNPSHVLYNEQLGTQYTDFDIDQANALLDAAGYDKRDADGIRLLSDGNRASFLIQYTGVETPEYGDALEIIGTHWKEIGIEMNNASVERSIYYSRGEANEHDFMIWGGAGGLDPTLDPRDIAAVHPQASWYGIPWTRWYLSGGTEGEEPPESMKKRLALWDAFKKQADQDKAQATFSEMLQISADEFELFGVTLPPPLIGVVNVKLRNVPEVMLSSWMYPDPGPTLPQTYFWSK